MKIVHLLPALALFCVACDQKPNMPSDSMIKDIERDAKQSAGQDTGEADRALHQKVRRFLIEDEFLSPEGKAVKVVILNGTVTLIGSVPQDKEKQDIERKVKNIEGVKKIDNKLTVSKP